MWLPQHTDSSNLSRLGQRVQGTKVLKRGTFLFSLFFLISVILQRVLVSSSPNAYGFIFFSFSVLVHPYQVHLSHTTFFIYIYIYRDVHFAFVSSVLLFIQQKEKNFQFLFLFRVVLWVLEGKLGCSQRAFTWLLEVWLVFTISSSGFFLFYSFFLFWTSFYEFVCTSLMVVGSVR